MTEDDPTTQLNYQIADMIADTFGRAVESFDIELANRIIAKVREDRASQFIPAVTQSAETDTTLALHRLRIAKWLDENRVDSYVLDMGLGKLIDELTADALLAGHAEGHSCTCRGES